MNDCEADMLKGINRNVIVVRGNGRSRFETVYFIMKRGFSSEKKELADEAQRLISDSGLVNASRKKRMSGGAWFALGAVIGIFLCSMLWLTILLSL